MSASGLRLDLHNHTSYSADGLMPVAVLLRTARKNGVGCIAVTDHNTVVGALEALALAEADPTLPRVIPGIVISTGDGDVIALYVTEPIPRGLPALETIRIIREKGGIVYLPHPFDSVRRGTIASQVREQVAEEADVVEVLNGKSLSPWSVRNSEALAVRHGKPRGAGSDAHGRTEVGTAYVVIDRQPTRDDLVLLIAGGVPREGLHWHEYLLNWALQPLAGVTRFRRVSSRRLLGR